MVEAFQWFRYAVLAVAGCFAIAGLAAMVVQRRMISPFSGAARAIRRATDPLIEPLEKRLLRSGRNPQAAPTWLIGIALVGGILAITLVQWLAQKALMLQAVGAMGGRPLVAVLVSWAFTLVMASLIVRVIASWFGVGPHAKWIRPFVFLTDWLLKPLRRVVPPFGPIDITPIVAYFVLLIARSVVMRLLFSG